MASPLLTIRTWEVRRARWWSRRKAMLKKQLIEMAGK